MGGPVHDRPEWERLQEWLHWNVLYRVFWWLHRLWFRVSDRMLKLRKRVHGVLWMWNNVYLWMRN